VSATGQSILVIDDNEMMRDLLEAHLTRAGYRVLTTHSGKSGIEMAKTQRPDVIICDMMMPEMDGAQVLQQLKNDPDYKLPPSFILTASPTPENRMRAIEAGAISIFGKPTPMKEMIEAIRGVLGA
jgi:two-component system alkaline phosphatase synthesis response regulator PhoP